MSPIAVPNTSQIINGNQWDWSSVELKLNNRGFGGVKSLDFEHSLEPGEGRGTRAQVTMRSRGKYSASGSLEMYAYEYHQFITELAAGVRGYMETPFDILVAYSETGLAITSFLLPGVRIKKEAHSHAEDGGMLTVKCDLSVLRVIPRIPGGSVPVVPVEPKKFIL